MINYVLVFFGVWLVSEVIIFFIIKSEKKNIPWLLTDSDKNPIFDLKAVKKFTATSFHPLLGWWRPSLSRGVEQGKNGEVQYSIDKNGSRQMAFDNKPVKIASFGDSYTFCRQVNDDETWQSHLAKKLNFNIQNFGVGNYGLDQAYLRYDFSDLSDDTDLIIIMFVPETICRVQSNWKHYLEFGNTFAFKPMFKLNSRNQLQLIKSPIKSFEDFKLYEKYLPQIQKNDRFYTEKFIRSIIKFPIIRNGFQNTKFKAYLICLTLLRFISKKVGLGVNKVDEKIRKNVMEHNFQHTYSLYKEPKSLMLMKELIRAFNQKVTIKNKRAIFVLAPQMLDLKLRATCETLPYEFFFQSLENEFNILDLTEPLSKIPIEELYVNDIYGGHFSVKGNEYVATILLEYFNCYFKGKLVNEKDV